MVRVVLTGLNAEGRSCVLSDGPPEELTLMRTGSNGNLLEGSRARVDAPLSPGVAEAFSGMTWRLDRRAHLHDLGANGDIVCTRSMTTFGPHTHAFLHATPTFDMDIVIAGEIELLLEGGSVVLSPGDSVIIPGVMHGWRTGDSNCLFSCTMFPVSGRLP